MAYTKYEMNITNRFEPTESNINRSYIIVERINITKEWFTAYNVIDIIILCITPQGRRSGTLNN